jgi:hypothetical protein
MFERQGLCILYNKYPQACAAKLYRAQYLRAIELQLIRFPATNFVAELNEKAFAKLDNKQMQRRFDLIL